MEGGRSEEQPGRDLGREALGALRHQSSLWDFQNRLLRKDRVGTHSSEHAAVSPSRLGLVSSLCCVETLRLAVLGRKGLTWEVWGLWITAGLREQALGWTLQLTPRRWPAAPPEGQTSEGRRGSHWFSTHLHRGQDSGWAAPPQRPLAPGSGNVVTDVPTAAQPEPREAVSPVSPFQMHLAGGPLPGGSSSGVSAPPPGREGWRGVDTCG